MVKKIYKNGLLAIPKKLRDQLSSNELELKIVQDDNGNNILIATPINPNKKAVVRYE